MSFRHSLRVRYSEIDKQGVLYNAHYMAYCDDTTDTWFRTVLADVFEQTVDVMLKHFTIEWSRPARLAETLDMTAQVTRFGNTSFEVEVTGSVKGEPSFRATIVYVCVKPGTTETMPAPEAMRSALA